MRGLEKQVLNGEISYSRMIEILNERLSLPESKNVPSEWNWDDGGASSIEAKAIIKKADERLKYANIRIQELEGKLKEEKPKLGLATTSELIYELSARCDTGSIDEGGNYKTVGNH